MQFVVKILSSLGLALLPLLSDYLMVQASGSQFLRAALDSGTHFLLGGLTWLVIEPKSLDSGEGNKRLFIVALVASLIDVDHFMAAKSFYLRRALAAPYRGIFHCSGLLLILNVLLWFHATTTTSAMGFLAAWLPHHIRDSTRRGFYLIPPQVHTAPLPYDLATLLIVSLPWFIGITKLKMFTLNQPVRTVFNV